MKNKILKRIDEIINEGEKFNISSTEFLLNTPIDLHDEISQWGRNSINSNYLRESDKFNNLILKIFSHYEANPSIDDRSIKIKKSYVKEGSSPHYLRWLNVANEGGISSLFYEKIVEEIKKTKWTDLRNGNYKRHFYLLGPKGCGKTTFINYFLTEKEDLLNKENSAITIRINSTLLQSSCSITEGLKYQLCKVLFNYYCADAPTENLNQSSIDRRFFSIQEFVDLTLFNKAEIESFFTYFIGKQKEKIKKIPTEFNSYFNSLINFLQKKNNVNFLFIIDNFDQLGIQDRDKGNYMKRIEELSTLLDDDDFKLGIFLIVLRTNTFFEIKSKFSFSIERTFTLKIPSINKIYAQRKTVLNLDTELFKNIEEQELYLDTYVKIVGSSFVNRLKKDKYEILSLDDSLEKLEKYASYNKRQMINIFRIFGQKGFKGERLIEYVRNIIDYENRGKELSGVLNYGYYRFFESLMLSDTGYCCRYNGYMLNEGRNDIQFNNRSEEPGEHNIIPNIFSFPFIKGRKQQFTPFVKIRILQSLRNLFPAEKISINELKDQLSELFGYNKNIIELACLELIEANCINIGDYQNVFYEYSQYTSQINITERGELILDTFPIKTNYLSISCEDIAFPLTFQIHQNVLFEQTLPIANYFDKQDFLTKNILFSVPRIIGLFSSIELNEFERFNKINKDVSLRFIDDDFKVIKHLKEDAIKTFDKIVDSFLEKNESDHFFKLPYKYMKLR